MALGADPSPNWVVVSRFLQGGIADDGGDTTVFRGVRAVQPGHDLLLRGGVTAGVPRQWWNPLDERETVPARYRDRVAMMRDRLARAVSLRLRSDVPCGIALSGGLDSSTVYGAAREIEQRGALMAATSGGAMPRLRAFSVSNPGSEIDERPWVDRCVKMWGEPADLEVVTPAPELLPQLMEEVTWYQEAPVWSPTVFALHELYRRVAATGTRVILEGHGADELLGGYLDHARTAVLACARQDDVLNAWRAARCWRRMQPRSGSPATPSTMTILAHAFPDSGLARWWRSRDRSAAVPGGDPFADVVTQELPDAWAVLAAHGRELGDDLDRLLYLDFRRRLPSWLRIFDRATMAAGVESRAPFMDVDVVQLGLSLPSRDKIGGISKRILRDAARPWLPPAVRSRRVKQPFAVPWWSWFDHPQVRSYVLDTVGGADFRQCGFLAGQRAATTAEAALRDRPSPAAAFGLWRVLNLFIWHRRFVDRGGCPPSLRPPPAMSDRLA